MSFWKTVATFAPLAAFAIPGVGPIAGTALMAGAKGAGKFFGSPGGAAVTNLAGDLIGAGLQSRSQGHAADLATASNQRALDYLQAQDARDYAEYLKERDRSWKYEDEDRGRGEEDRQLKLLREREREGRLAPFRQGAERGYQTLSSLLFNPQQPMGRSVPVGNTGRVSLADLMRQGQ